MPGTTAEAVKAPVQEQAQQPASEEGLDGKKGSTKETYSKSEVEELWKSREGKIGLKIKTERDTYRTQLAEVSKERDTIKGQLDSFKADIDNTKKEIADLKSTLETLDSEDAVKVKQLIKDKTRELADLTTERKALEPEKQMVAKHNRDQLVYTVASEHGLETPDQLNAFMEAADDLGINDRTKLEALAKHRGLKPQEESVEDEKPKASPPKAFSGVTHGGSESLANKSTDEKYDLAYSKRK